MKKIEVVIPCRNYGDFLFFTLPWSLKAFDDVLVVTSHEDVETQRVCDYYHARCLVTDAFDRCGGPLNKGAAINEGLSSLPRNDWLLLLDADILTPPHLRSFLDAETLCEDKLYGVDRRNCNGWPTLQKILSGESFFGSLPLLPRIRLSGGEPPVGYFQLFHTSYLPAAPWYEDSHQYADRTDAIFARLFDRRGYLPTWVVHLDQGLHTGGKNWQGRKSLRFVEKSVLMVDLGLN